MNTHLHRAFRADRRSAVCGKNALANVKPIPCGDAKVMCRFEVCVSAGGEEKVQDMCDYGTAADNFDNNDPYFFNVYL